MVRNVVLQGSNKEQKVSDIISGVSDVVSEMCSCSFVTDIIRSYEFSCRGSVSSVVFRAELKYYSYTEEYTASDFVEIISSWVGNGASLAVDDSRLSVDSTCPTNLESFEADDCQSPTAPIPTTSSSNFIVIGGVAAACLIFLLATIVSLVATVMICKRKGFFSVRYVVIKRFLYFCAACLGRCNVTYWLLCRSYLGGVPLHKKTLA